MASRTNIILKVGNRKTHSPSTDIPQDTDEMTTVQIMHEIEEHNYAEKNPSVDGDNTTRTGRTIKKSTKVIEMEAAAELMVAQQKKRAPSSPKSILIVPALAKPTPASPTTMSRAPIPIKPVSKAPTPINPVSIAPIPINPVSIAPIPINPVSISPIPINPVSIASLPTNPVSIAPIHINPVSIAPIHINPVSVAPMPINPVSIAPIHIKPVSIVSTPFNPVSTSTLISPELVARVVYSKPMFRPPAKPMSMAPTPTKPVATAPKPVATAPRLTQTVTRSPLPIKSLTTAKASPKPVARHYTTSKQLTTVPKKPVPRAATPTKPLTTATTTQKKVTRAPASTKQTTTAPTPTKPMTRSATPTTRLGTSRITPNPKAKRVTRVVSGRSQKLATSARRNAEYRKRDRYRLPKKLMPEPPGKDVEPNAISKFGRVRKKSARVMEMLEAEEATPSRLCQLPKTLRQLHSTERRKTPERKRRVKQPFTMDMLKLSKLRTLVSTIPVRYPGDAVRYPGDTQLFKRIPQVKLVACDLPRESKVTVKEQVKARVRASSSPPKATSNTGPADTSERRKGASPVRKPDISKKNKNRGLTAYMVFCNAHRAKIIKEYPSMDFLTVSKVMGKMWSSQTEREKKPWQRAAQLLNRHGGGRRSSTSQPVHRQKVTPPPSETRVHSVSSPTKKSSSQSIPSPLIEYRAARPKEDFHMTFMAECQDVVLSPESFFQHPLLVGHQCKPQLITPKLEPPSDYDRDEPSLLRPECECSEGEEYDDEDPPMMTTQGIQTDLSLTLETENTDNRKRRFSGESDPDETSRKVQRSIGEIFFCSPERPNTMSENLEPDFDVLTDNREPLEISPTSVSILKLPLNDNDRLLLSPCRPGPSDTDTASEETLSPIKQRSTGSAGLPTYGPGEDEQPEEPVNHDHQVLESENVELRQELAMIKQDLITTKQRLASLIVENEGLRRRLANRTMTFTFAPPSQQSSADFQQS